MALQLFITRKRKLVRRTIFSLFACQTVLCQVESQMKMGQTSAVMD